MASHATERLEATVKSEALKWGDDVAEAYHGRAAEHMDAQWAGWIQPFLDKYPFDLRRVADFAAGYGRNTRKLLAAGAENVVMIDVNPECIAYLTKNLQGPNLSVFQNNGYDLKGLPSDNFTFFYSFDAMVHFDMEIIISYIPEISRVLAPGGYALMHHSNYTGNPGGEFMTNPHARNFMSADIFKHVALRSGLEVVEQKILDWGEPDLDCVSIVRRK